MKFYRYLYTGDKIKNAGRYKLRLKTHKMLVGFYVISLSGGKNQLDIINAFNLKLGFYRKHPIVVVGIAKSYDEAVELVIRMTNEAMEKTGKPDIKDYLIKRVKTKDFTDGCFQ